MWVMTTVGFFSVVQDRADAGRVVVRARRRADLERLLAIPEMTLITRRQHLRVTSTPTADYPVRIAMPSGAWAVALDALAFDIRYDNFKAAVKETDPDAAAAYTEVWSVLADRLDDRGPRLAAPIAPDWHYEPAAKRKKARKPAKKR